MIRDSRFTRAAAVASAVAIGVGALSGCGANQASDDKASQTLTYWSMWKEGEPQQVVLADAIKKFEADTGITVDVQWSGRDVIKQIIPRQAAGNPPDLFDQAGSIIASSFAASDGVRGLADVYDSKPTGESAKISEVVPDALSSLFTNDDDEPIVVPYQVAGTTLWYNGLKLPDLNAPSWDEFVAELDKLKANGEAPLAVDGDQAFYETYWYVMSAIRHGGPEIVNDMSTDKTGAAVEDPAILAAAEDILTLVKGGYFPKDFAATKWPAQQTGWADGSNKTSFLLMGSWAPSETGAALEKSGIDVASTIQYRSMPFPTVDGGAGNDATWVDDFGFAIPTKAKNAEAAEEFIRFFMAKEQIDGIASEAANLTPRADVEPPAELADFADEYAASAEADALVIAPEGSISNPDWANKVLYPTVADLFNSKFDTAEAFVAALKERTISSLEAQG